MDSSREIISTLCENDLHLKLIPRTTADRDDIYKMYRKYAGHLAMPLYVDELYVMDNQGQVLFIGSLKSLSNFCNKLKNKDKIK